MNLRHWLRAITTDSRREEFGSLIFRCNICGSACCAPIEKLQRETPSCECCGSTVRTRSIIHVLSLALFGESRVLPDFPVDRKVRGIGLSDWDGYADGLARKVDYTNTYYHKEPRLDIGATDQPLAGSLQFLISSDVFEHVAPPVDRAFANAARLLRPGGVFVLTVPYTLNAETVEHFPELHSYEVVEQRGEQILLNTTASGQEQIFKNLVFHGGDGSTLEMRVFCETAVLAHLQKAGFKDITVHRGPEFKFGIYQPQTWSLPISARA